MKLLYFPLFIILWAIPLVPLTDPIDDVAALIRKGDVTALSKLFAPNVEIIILDDDNSYSKAQAGLILDKFFSQNKPTAVKILHKVNSNASYHFGVLILTTDKGTFRIAYTLKGPVNNVNLIELRIETEKVK